MKKKIYLIQPTYRDQEGRLLKGKNLFTHSLALPALSAAIPADWEKEFCLEYFEDVNYGIDASVVGISSKGFDFFHACEVAGRFKKEGKTVIFGGQQAQLNPERFKTACNAVALGSPGPDEMGRLLSDIETGRLASEYHFSPKISFPFDYSVFEGKDISLMPVLSSLGCRNQCEFCCIAALHKGRYWLRNLDHVLQDLHAVRRKSRYVAFLDANIYNDREHLVHLCRRMVEERLGILWGADCTVDVGEDEEVLRLLRRAGCRMLCIGLETPNQRSLDAIKKPYPAGGYRTLLQRIREAGIYVTGYFILGLDGDTAAAGQELYDFIKETQIRLPLLNLLLPAPGTKIFDRLRKEGRLLIRSEDELLRNNLFYNTCCNQCFFIPKQMSPQEAESQLMDLGKRLCSLSEILRRSAVANLRMATFLFSMNLSYRRDWKKIIVARSERIRGKTQSPRR